MKPRLLWLLAMILFVQIPVMAETKYNASFYKATAEDAIQILKKSTGCDFVYHKSLLKDNANTVSGSFNNVTLDELLEATIRQQLDLSYKVVDKTVSLSQPDKTPYAMNGVLQGTVVDSSGEPLPGATVMLKGTHYGVSADIDGNFSIIINHTEPELVVSYVGMYPRTVRLNPENVTKPMKIILETNVSTMDEVVVTGYQNIKRENATGSYTIITGDELNKRHNSDVASSLEGNIPGLVKNRNKYATGENDIVIRGVGTFQASSAPLVVVDGLPIEGGIETVNNYDIQSVTVLKDASAASIYGARASNGVIVITTKQADREKLSIDFNADLSITGKYDYSKAGWANAAQLIQLEKLNWQGMLDNDTDQLQSLLSQYNNEKRYGISPVTRMLIDNYQGGISTEQMNATFDQWANNDYRKEWQNATQRATVEQRYNLSLRNQGKILASSFTFNYADSNLGMKKESDRSFQFRYKGDLKAAKWLDLSFSVNVMQNRTKRNAVDAYSDINSFRPYQSMYNADGTLARMEADALLDDPVFSNPDFGLKDHSFNLLNEIGLNKNRYTSTNIRAYAHALFHIPVKGWNASLMYQHEDITSQSETEYMTSSYYARDIYNRYTTGGVTSFWEDTDIDVMDFIMNPGAYDDSYSYYDPNTYEFFEDANGNKMVKHRVERVTPTVHHVPDGGMLSTYNSHARFYTFRAQTDFTRNFAEKHDVSVVAGFEFRQSRTNTNSTYLLGYDHQTMTNQNVFADWEFINGFGQQGILGAEVPPSGLYAQGMFGTSETLHRYYSYYFTGSYVYDSRYSVFGSYRVDKTDLFGTDPKFRGRPLWSVGGSWNAHNEKFLQSLTWLDALKLRVSYGLTGNIDPNATSYMVATMKPNRFNGGNYGNVTQAPNDQLRWEKTSTWNAGLDFALFGYRLNGSIDAYRKFGSDLLTDVGVDVTTGWPDNLLLNAGEMLNTGFELQLNGRILQARSRREVAVDLGVTFGYNHNKVKKVYFHPNTGSEFRSMSLKQGYPLNTCVMVDYAGFQEIDGVLFGTWRDHNGEVHNTSLGSADFTIEDCVYMGTYTPVWTGGIMPEVRWQGFSLSAMMHFYGGHVMNTDPRVWSTFYGGSAGYAANTPASALDYWNGVEGTLPNGYATKYLNSNTATIGSSDYRNIESANYLKLRSITLSYDFERKLIRKLGLNDLRLRFQVDNVGTWVRNSRGWDPEATRPVNGLPLKTPATYTMSLLLNL
ncbi:MAG: SusC/RagA family TonB-linked outer membrane protein [Bacteroides sp.]|nr:SusC/RagA family TonB-linked outer membrane protein [Bacteroides sp.]